MPYRVDFRGAGADTFDRLVELGALDVECSDDGELAALMPDSVRREQVGGALPGMPFRVSPATGRDADSVWVLRPRPIRVGRLDIVPADDNHAAGGLKLIDAAAFGTGLHPTTALCLEALDALVHAGPLDSVLDVGTGSGVLALAALRLGVPRALAIDVDDEALRVAAENARINGLVERVQFARGGAESVDGRWPLVLANVLASPLIEMAPALGRRVGHHGRLVLSGIAESAAQEVERAYRRLGMHRVDLESRAGWVALVMRASW
jgi:ribosomal protein L11 methyltransferase